MSDMGTFRTTILIENPLQRGTTHALPDTLVDTGAELTWAPTAVLGRSASRARNGWAFAQPMAEPSIATSGMRSSTPAAQRRLTRWYSRNPVT